MSVCEMKLTRYASAAEIRTLVRGFELGTLPRAEWTHAAHLTVALWYCLRHTPQEATRLMRDGIRKYNAAQGITDTPTGGYHETLTVFWMRVVRRYLNEVSTLDCPLASLANGLVAWCGDRNLPFAYYTRERLMSAEARTRWVEPDLKEFREPVSMIRTAHKK